MLQVVSEVICSFSNFPLTGQKDEHVSPIQRVHPQLIKGLCDGLVEPMVSSLFKWAITDLHGKGAARDRDDGSGPTGRGKVIGEPLRVNGGRGHDDFEVWPPGENFLQVAEQEINVQTSLMGLIDDDGVIGLQERVALRLRQEYPVRHEFDGGLRAELIVKAHFVAHDLAQGGAKLLRDALGN